MSLLPCDDVWGADCLNYDEAVRISFVFVSQAMMSSMVALVELIRRCQIIRCIY